MNNLNSDSPIIKITRPNLEHLLYLSLPIHAVSRTNDIKRTLYHKPGNELVAVFERGKATLLDPLLIELAREHYEFEK